MTLIHSTSSRGEPVRQGQRQEESWKEREREEEFYTVVRMFVCDGYKSQS